MSVNYSQVLHDHDDGLVGDREIAKYDYRILGYTLFCAL